MKKFKKIIIFLIIILVIIFLSLNLKKVFKKSKNGNNMSSQEIVDEILNVNYYKSNVYVQINSNKNSNKYILNQEYNQENEMIQEVVEPENIAGVKIVKKDNTLTIQNSNLDLKTIFENYNGLENNALDLISFIKDYKENPDSNYEEKNGEIILQTKSNTNKYISKKILYINKEEVIPTKLVIQDNNQNTTINIEYNNIELN